MNEQLKILVVDDNRDLAVNIQDILEENGYSVSVAVDGAGAAELCREEDFDLALLDYKLPDTDGLQLQEQLSELIHADYIIITAHASVESAAAAVQRKQIVGYETKPLEFRRLLGFIQQIGERRRAEKELEQTNAILKAVFQTIPAHINVTDSELKLLDVNIGTEVLSKLGCKDKKDIIGQKCYEVFGQRSSDCALARCMQSGKPEIRFSTSHEDELFGISTKIYTAPIRDRHNNITGAVECAVDITDLKKMEAELRSAKEAAEAATQAKTEFLANMSHEIRTPANAIVGFSRILKDTPLNLEQNKYVDRILAASDMLLSVITDILDLSKIEAGRIDLEETDFNLNQMVQEVVEVVSVKAKEKNLRICHKIDPAIYGELSGDVGRLRQVLLNLTGNAVKFTEKGEIRVYISLDNETDTRETLRFSVQDTGIGLSEDQTAILFKPFSQADTSFSRRYGGAGLGLAISKKIAKMMGGDIGVRSELGLGSTFWFTAVLKKRFLRETSVQTEQKGPEPSGKIDISCRILVAEDDLLSQQIMQIMLKNLGCLSDIAGNGREVLQMLNENTYAMVLMDIQMPETNGIEAAKIIRGSDAAFKDIPIIAVTAHATDEDRATCLSAGMNGYLTKPVKPDKLRTAICEHLGT
jgi:signal transduction histidine kinase/DNA-binding response OmpR family regulator